MMTSTDVNKSQSDVNKYENTELSNEIDSQLSDVRDEFGLSAEAVRILQAVLVLIDEQPTVGEIASQASVSARTVYKWTSDPRFIRAQQKICGSLIGLNLPSLTKRAITKAHKGSEVLLTKLLTTGGIFAEEGLNVHVEVNTTEIDRLGKSLEDKIAKIGSTLALDTEFEVMDVDENDIDSNSKTRASHDSATPEGLDEPDEFLSDQD